MTQEEKAKAYDDLLVKLQKAKVDNDVCDERYCCVIDDIVPELKESEDERIRKTIYGWIYTQHSEFFDNGFSKEEMLAWVEKQGEQKNFDYENANIQQKDFAPKQEPKFKVGDLIVNDYCMGKVIELTDDAYLLDTGQGIPFSCEHNAHLWSIEDAKDGDVLATKKGNPFIYDKNRYNNGLAYYYAGLDVNKELTLKSPHHMLAHFGELRSVFPTTKKQRDLLFQKMKEAGYDWNAEKKELKKIEQSIDIPFGAKDSELQEVSYYIPEGFHAEIDGNKVVIKKGEQKSAWSEEDERMRQYVVGDLKFVKGLFNDPNYAVSVERVEKEIDWMESLKERYTWEPSDEQMDNLSRAFNGATYRTSLLRDLYLDLKKLKEENYE